MLTAVRCISSLRSLPSTTITPLVNVVPRCIVATPSITSVRPLSFWKAPLEGTPEAGGIPDAKEHAKGRDLEQVEARLKGEERFVLGELKGPFGTFANPTVVHSANAERTVGCMGDAGEYEHQLLWMLVRDNGKKHMCQACGQFFILKRDPSGAAAPIH